MVPWHLDALRLADRYQVANLSKIARQNLWKAFGEPGDLKAENSSDSVMRADKALATFDNGLTLPVLCTAIRYVLDFPHEGLAEKIFGICAINWARIAYRMKPEHDCAEFESLIDEHPEVCRLMLKYMAASAVKTSRTHYSRIAKYNQAGFEKRDDF